MRVVCSENFCTVQLSFNEQLSQLLGYIPIFEHTFVRLLVAFKIIAAGENYISSEQRHGPGKVVFKSVVVDCEVCNL